MPALHPKGVILLLFRLADVTEGVAKNFTCEVFHSCKKQTPDITWNYENMPETVKTKQNRGSGWVTKSNVSFLASMEDHGKKLTCTAKFPHGEITASVVLYVQMNAGVSGCRCSPAHFLSLCRVFVLLTSAGLRCGSTECVSGWCSPGLFYPLFITR
uniref:Ig-like domain-containing protein n=1 Tax=Pygocentrus nattereri TaxID=42514 RepID=A0AAR2JCF9_PYGNA